MMTFVRLYYKSFMSLRVILCAPCLTGVSQAGFVVNYKYLNHKGHKGRHEEHKDGKNQPDAFNTASKVFTSIHKVNKYLKLDKILYLVDHLTKE